MLLIAERTFARAVHLLKLAAGLFSVAPDASNSADAVPVRSAVTSCPAASAGPST